MAETPLNVLDEQRNKLRPKVRQQFPDLSEEELEALLTQMVHRDIASGGSGPRW